MHSLAKRRGGSEDTSQEIDGVLLYDEHALASCDGGPDVVHGPDLVADLQQAGSAFERERTIRAELRALDIDWLEFVKVRWDGDAMQPVSVLRTYSAPRWSAAYVRNRFWEIDRRVPPGANAGAPQLWSLEDAETVAVESEPRSPTSMLDALAASGVGSGISFVLAGPGAVPGTALHFLSRSRGLLWATRDVLAGALLLGVCMNEFITRHTVAAGSRDVASTMSTLQTRIAQCVVRGYSDKEVARTLELTPYTVDYHLRALRNKFNVRNRVQLAQAIGRAGLPPAQ